MNNIENLKQRILEGITTEQVFSVSQLDFKYITDELTDFLVGKYLYLYDKDDNHLIVDGMISQVSRDLAVDRDNNIKYISVWYKNKGATGYDIFQYAWGFLSPNHFMHCEKKKYHIIDLEIYV